MEYIGLIVLAIIAIAWFALIIAAAVAYFIGLITFTVFLIKRKKSGKKIGALLIILYIIYAAMAIFAISLPIKYFVLG